MGGEAPALRRHIMRPTRDIFENKNVKLKKSYHSGISILQKMSSTFRILYEVKAYDGSLDHTSKENFQLKGLRLEMFNGILFLSECTF